MARLIIQTGTDESVMGLELTETSIGRGSANTIPLRDSKMSRNHATVVMNEDGYLLMDLESHNGTYVNQNKIKKRLLQHGDIINIGFTRIIFEDHEATGVINPDTQSLVDTDESASQPDLGDGKTGTSYEITRLTAENKIMRKMQEITKALNSTHNSQTLLRMIVDSAMELMGAMRGFLIRMDGQDLTYVVARGASKVDLPEEDWNLSKSIILEVHNKGVSLMAADAQKDERFRGFMSVVSTNLASLLCVPLIVREENYGVIYLDNHDQKSVFNKHDLRYLRSFADQASLAIFNAWQFEEIKDKQAELVQEKDHVEKLNLLLEEKVNRTEEELDLVKQDFEKSKQELKLKYRYDNLIGKSAPMQTLYRMLDKVTDSHFPVLIQGSSGTGKELVAKAIHYNGPRKDARFIGENVSAISSTLLESELFGHVRGAFTGASRDKKGLFELAHKGTLFLDEIGEMSLEMQKKLLRVLQEGEIRQVGGKDVVKVNVRIISATNRDLKKMIGSGDFREDLYYRLNVFNILIAPLRERKDDIPLLVEHFLERIAKDQGMAKKTIGTEVIRYLLNYDWPGNIRELQNEVEKLAALSDDSIDAELLSPHILDFKAGAQSDDEDSYQLVGKTLREIERETITQTLQHLRGKKVEAARMLGIPRKTLYNKIKYYELDV
ncbi:sigma 54-interacting transcriptional regulator [Planctomycetota bacterium]